MSAQSQESLVDYEDAARKLIVFSRSLAKGSLNAAQGLSVGEAPVLEYLAKHKGEEKTPSELAERLSYSRPRMTRILDSLVEKGFAERRNDANDRRRVLVKITEAGITNAQERNSQGIGAVAKELSAMGEDNARALLQALELGYKNTYGASDYLPGSRDNKKSKK